MNQTENPSGENKDEPDRARFWGRTRNEPDQSLDPYGECFRFFLFLPVRGGGTAVLGGDGGGLALRRRSAHRLDQFHLLGRVRNPAERDYDARP